MRDEDDRNELDPNAPQNDEEVRGREDESFEDEQFEEDLEDQDEFGDDSEPISEVE
jgi:hypothetical protein